MKTLIQAILYVLAGHIWPMGRRSPSLVYTIKMIKSYNNSVDESLISVRNYFARGVTHNYILLLSGGIMTF